jgi:hypothetical protein
MATRRQFIAGALEAIGAVAIVAATPTRAHACLGGTWVVRCPNGHDDTVTQGTCQHVCEKCGRQAFDGDVVTVVCPNGHPNRITTGKTTSYVCPTCKTECRRDSTKPSPSQRDRPDHK